MPNLKEVKNRINSVKSTQQITKAMKMVAASKLRKAQDSILQLRPYAEKLNSILENVTSATDNDIKSEYAADRDINNVIIVVVTSDKGLCGAFNSNIIKLAVKHIETNYPGFNEEGKLRIMPIGKKSYEYFAKRGYNVIDDHYELFQSLSFDNVKNAAEHIMYEFVEEKVDKVELFYNEFKNVATQIQRTENFLPIERSVEEDEEQEISDQNRVDYLIEPSIEFIIQDLIPQSLKIKFYKAVLESNASEHGARMTAMDKATDNAGELIKDLTLMYNRTRQAAITKEILEIVSGAEALSQN